METSKRFTRKIIQFKINNHGKVKQAYNNPKEIS